MTVKAVARSISLCMQFLVFFSVAEHTVLQTGSEKWCSRKIKKQYHAEDSIIPALRMTKVDRNVGVWPVYCFFQV